MQESWDDFLEYLVHIATHQPVLLKLLLKGGNLAASCSLLHGIGGERYSARTRKWGTCGSGEAVAVLITVTMITCAARVMRPCISTTPFTSNQIFWNAECTGGSAASGTRGTGMELLLLVPKRLQPWLTVLTRLSWASRHINSDARPPSVADPSSRKLFFLFFFFWCTERGGCFFFVSLRSNGQGPGSVETGEAGVTEGKRTMQGGCHCRQSESDVGCQEELDSSELVVGLSDAKSERTGHSLLLCDCLKGESNVWPKASATCVMMVMVKRGFDGRGSNTVGNQTLGIRSRGRMISFSRLSAQRSFHEPRTASQIDKYTTSNPFRWENQRQAHSQGCKKEKKRTAQKRQHAVNGNRTCFGEAITNARLGLQAAPLHHHRSPWY
ncbi:hypothetical protein B0H17DRAFT_1152483 [Mycena rosella]|uniref:Uncharacterized protein n=1 Tax=Mycena rosella TaxID=1033263 RepID=A0AAD7FFU4_MYCRO|nr:hypothetical protein B0H17DRAFT_1152483 [Mycena rosella]